jgi:hypothetical protein
MTLGKALKEISPHRGCDWCLSDMKLYSNVTIATQRSRYVKAFKDAQSDGEDSVSCCHGKYYFDRSKFYWWSITPSSEDKGYSSY